MTYCAWEQEEFGDGHFVTVEGVTLHKKRPLHTTLGVEVKRNRSGAIAGFGKPLSKELLNLLGDAVAGLPGTAAIPRSPR